MLGKAKRTNMLANNDQAEMCDALIRFGLIGFNFNER
jgi:hypothetical protein